MKGSVFLHHCSSRWAPDPFIPGLITPGPYELGYNPSYPLIRSFTGVIIPFITGRGPPCCLSFLKWPNIERRTLF